MSRRHRLRCTLAGLAALLVGSSRGDAEPSLAARMPSRKEVVWVLKDNKEHATFKRLGTLARGATFAFDGRVYETDGAGRIRATGETLEIVEKAIHRSSRDLVDLAVSSSAGQARLTGTREHPFYVPAEKAFKPMQSLSPGSSLQGLGRASLTIDSTNELQKATPTPVFNMRVARTHTYFVCADAESCALVHNDSGCAGTGSGGPRIVRGPYQYNGRTVVVVDPGDGNAPQMFYRSTGEMGQAGTWSAGYGVGPGVHPRYGAGPKIWKPMDYGVPGGSEAPAHVQEAGAWLNNGHDGGVGYVPWGVPATGAEVNEAAQSVGAPTARDFFRARSPIW